MDSPNFAQVTAALKNDFEFSQLTRKEERIKHLLKVLPFQKLFNNIQYQVDLAHPHVAKSRLQAADYLQDALSKENRGDLVGALFSIKKALLCAESPASGGSPLAMLYRQLARIQQKLLNYKGAVWAANQSLYLLEKDREGIHEEAKKELLAFLSEQTHEYGEVRNRINDPHVEDCSVNSAFRYKPLFMVMMTDQAEANQKAITLTSQRTGLHWTATEVIAAETPILDEKPFVHESQDLDTCDCCRLNLDGQIIPCLHCNQVIYCHRDCASLHQTDWHSVACGGLLQVVRKIGPVAVLLFQMIAKAGGPRLAMELYESRRDYQVEQYLNSEDCQKVSTAPFKMACLLSDKFASETASVEDILSSLDTCLILLLAFKEDILAKERLASLVAMMVDLAKSLTADSFTWTSLSSSKCTFYPLVSSSIQGMGEPTVYFKLRSDGFLSVIAKRHILGGQMLTFQSKDETEKDPDKESPSFKCDCPVGNSAQTHQQYQLHQLVVHTVRPVPCLISGCKRVLKTQYLQLIHMAKRHNKKLFGCQELKPCFIHPYGQCDQHYNDWHSFLYALDVCLSIYPIQCLTCGRGHTRDLDKGLRRCLRKHQKSENPTRKNKWAKLEYFKSAEKDNKENDWQEGENENSERNY